MIYNKKKVDFIIVGQGLAGSLLSWRLLQQGRSVVIIDPCLEQSASRTAAGLINPITGKRLVKTSHIEKYLPSAKQLYDELSAIFAKVFWHYRQQTRVFQSYDELKQFQKRTLDYDYKPYLGKQISAGDKAYIDEQAIGGFEQKECGYLDTVLLLDTLHQFFKEQGCFIKQYLNIDELIIGDSTICWEGIEARKIIFCDGHNIRNNPWFSWLPMQPVQGEIFTLKTAKTLPNEIVQFGKWLLPINNNQFKLGSTWQRQPLDEQATEKSESELMNALEQQFPYLAEAELIKKKVGVRLGTRDKMPFLGDHPYHSALCVFNGFGSKGTLMIPWFSSHFCNHLTRGMGLPGFADIKRYKNDCPTR